LANSALCLRDIDAYYGDGQALQEVLLHLGEVTVEGNPAEVETGSRTREEVYLGE
jgi:hypothetical protein